MSILGRTRSHGFNFSVLNRTEKKTHEIKLAIVGNSCVGKSSLVNRIARDTYTENIASTIGASFIAFIHKRGGQCYRFQLWDTAGQERFKSLVPMYLRDSRVVLIVFDLTSQRSYEDAIEYWYGESIKHTKDATKVLIGAKLDLNKNRVINKEAAEEFAKANGLKYIECSSKTSENIPRTRELIINAGIEEMKKHNSDEVYNTNNTDVIRLGAEEDPSFLEHFKSKCAGYQCYS